MVHRFEHEGVQALRAGRFKLGINTTAIVYRLGTTLIDTGPPNQWPAVRRFIREQQVDRVLITHHHEDHAGNAARIQRATNAALLAPEAGIPLMAGGFPLRRYQRVIWGTPRRFEAQPLPDELHLADRFLLRVLPAPGHAPDMVCFLEPNRGWLFTADLFVASKLRYLRKDEDLHELIRTLHRILQHDFDTLFCAHRGVVTNARQAIQDKCDYLESLRERVRRLHAQGQPIPQITRTLLGKEDLPSHITFNHFSKQNLVAACLAPEH